MLSNGINGSIKFLFHSPRPFWVTDKVVAYIHETSFGIPSGHSQHAVVMWGYFAALVKKTWIRWLLILVFVLVGLSRIYLGVHFILDVLVGWLIGGIILFSFIYLEKKFSNQISSWKDNKKIGAAVLVSFILIILAVLMVQLNSNWQFSPLYQKNINRVFEGETINPFALDGVITASAAWLGIVIGVVLISKTIPLGRITSSNTKKIIRFIIGLIGVMILWAGLRLIFPDDIPFISESLRFVRYFLVGFWIAAGAPYLFKKLNL
ncbi:MAG: phosphatase PAP2 family protein [Anaerolineaceae bacterium]|nr:phosphatase PAP2 family protein [Anaerolineaceae bacterium]